VRLFEDAGTTVLREEGASIRKLRASDVAVPLVISHQRAPVPHP
jgi:hypothetical protein